jgi:hypothetical protein
MHNRMHSTTIHIYATVPKAAVDGLLKPKHVVKERVQ